MVAEGAPNTPRTAICKSNLALSTLAICTFTIWLLGGGDGGQ